jgi:hypothetical protein
MGEAARAGILGWWRAVLVGVVLLSASVARAEDEPGKVATLASKLGQVTKSEALTIEVLGYFRYWYNIQDGAVEEDGEKEPNKNSFELWRFYFGLKARIAPWLSARFTADVGPDKKATVDVNGESYKTTMGDTRYGLYVKYAWLEARLVEGLSIRAGVIDNAYHNFSDKFWGYRYVARNVGEEEKLWDSADLGVVLKYALPGGLGDLSLGAVNGAGFKRALDTDEAKEIWFHFMLFPFAKLGPVAKGFAIGVALYQPLLFSADEDRGLTFSSFVGFTHPYFTLGYQLLGQYVDAADKKADPEEGVAAQEGERSMGLGHALYLRVDTPIHLGLLGQFGMWDADVGDEEVQTRFRVLTGLSYTPIPLFSVAISSLFTWLSAYAGSDPRETDITLLLSTQIEF